MVALCPMASTATGRGKFIKILNKNKIKNGKRKRNFMRVESN